MSLNNNNTNIPKGCYFFLSALSAERKKKLKLSVLCASSELSEWAVRNLQINTCSKMCWQENGNNMMLPVVNSKFGGYYAKQRYSVGFLSTPKHYLILF
jgi:hypothetical protein